MSLAKIAKAFIFASAVLASGFSLFAQDFAEGWYFYSPEDVSNVRKSAKTARGKKILSKLKSFVDERKKHSFDFPEGKIGRSHGFFCPDDSVMLEFRIDKPHEHLCRVCKKIWKGGGFDAAWRNMWHAHNMKDYLQANMWLYMASSDKQYADNIKEALLKYAEAYPKTKEPSADELKKHYHLSRFFDQWLDDCAVFYVYARAFETVRKDIPADDQKKIVDNFFKLVGEQQMNRTGGANWQVWNNAFRATDAIVLRDSNMLDAALNGKDGKKNGIRDSIAREVNPDGWYFEASPGYHFYPLQAFLAAADAAKCRGENLFDEKFYNMFGGIAKGVYGDLSFIAHNDGWYGQSLYQHAPMYEFAYARMKRPFLRELLAHVYAKVERDSPESLLNPEDIKPISKPFKLESTIFENTGYAILRDGKNAASLLWGQSGGGHGHPHRLVFTLHDGKTEIVSDLGTSGYGAPSYRGWYGHTIAHNTVTVDFKDQSMRNARGELVEFKPSKSGGSVEANANKSYEGVKMNRKIALDNGIFTDKFKCESAVEHTYDYALMLRVKPNFGKLKLEDAKLNDDVGYKFIKDVKRVLGVKNSLEFKLGRHLFKIESKEPIEVYVGTAPGAVSEDVKNPEDCLAYPLIVRSKAKDLEISTTAKLN